MMLKETGCVAADAPDIRRASLGDGPADASRRLDTNQYSAWLAWSIKSAVRIGPSQRAQQRLAHSPPSP